LTVLSWSICHGTFATSKLVLPAACDSAMAVLETQTPVLVRTWTALKHYIKTNKISALPLAITSKAKRKKKKKN